VQFDLGLWAIKEADYPFRTKEEYCSRCDQGYGFRQIAHLTAMEIPNVESWRCNVYVIWLKQVYGHFSNLYQADSQQD